VRVISMSLHKKKKEKRKRKLLFFGVAPPNSVGHGASIIVLPMKDTRLKEIGL
jgi:hypothetical protein